ncbi:MAG: hypothetical protein IJ660_00800 [Alphaproteobacteria bacterium]|nr:hypothetical protein [Alphaproteobacteria bacterium]
MISSIFWFLWRRLYGWGDFKKILSRTIQTIIAIVVLAWQFTNDYDWQTIAISLALATWVIIQYWSRAVGEIIDAGLNPCQGRKSYDMWFRPVCNWIVEFLNWILPDKFYIHKYYGVYDWIYSAMRNFIGVLPTLFLYPSWLWWILVFCMYPIYLFWYWVFDKCPNLYSSTILKYITLNEPKNCAEVCHGAVFGFVVGLL